MNPASFWSRPTPQVAPAGEHGSEAIAPAWVVRGFVAANVLAIAIIATLTGLSLANARRAQLERASLGATRTAQALQQSFQGEIDQIDLLLRSTILALQRDRHASVQAPDALEKIVQGHRALLPHVEALHVTDVADRDDLRQARAAPGRLVASQPLTIPSSPRPVVVFSRRFDKPDGSFAGIVYATVAAEHFQETLSAVTLGPGSEASLRTSSLRLVARNPAAPREDIGRVPAAQGNVGGVERRTARAAVGAYPFIVLVSLSVEETATQWHHELWSTLGLAAVTLMAVAISSWLLRQAWLREVRHAAQRLREANRHRAWLRTASDGIHVVDRQGRLIEFSDSFAAMLGYERSQMAGFDVTQWETAPADDALQWCRQTQGDQRFKTRHRRSDGSEIDVEISTTTSVIDGEELIFCASRDITERRRLEAKARAALQQARESEQRVREIADNVPAGITYVDHDERMQFVNAELARWFGRNASDLIGRRIREVMNPERYARRQVPYAAVWRGETVRIIEHIPSLRGNIRHVETVLVPKRDDAGQVVGFYSLSQDRTERVRMESTLERQARNLAAMTSISDDIMVVIDESGAILLANRAFEDAWQLPPGGAVGRSISGMYGDSFFHDVIRPKLRHALDGQPVKVRTTHTLPGRTTRVFDASYHPVYNEHGLIDAVVFTAHDVNDLVHSRDELVHTVEQLQRSNESLEQFVRVTSHDLREPLNSITQFVRLIEESGPLPPPADRYFAFVHRGAVRMRTMLDDLLRFVRLEGEAIEPEDTHPLDEVLGEVRAALHAQIEASQGELRCDPLPLVRGRRSLLVLLFQNLVSNALKFTRPGVPPNVHVSAARHGSRVAVTVADQGIGIAPEHIPTLFEPFRRLHRRQVYEGTGLGLATCKRIAMALDATLEIHSSPGEGTRVTVTLPGG